MEKKALLPPEGVGVPIAGPDPTRGDLMDFRWLTDRCLVLDRAKFAPGSPTQVLSEGRYELNLPTRTEGPPRLIEALDTLGWAGPGIGFPLSPNERFAIGLGPHGIGWCADFRQGRRITTWPNSGAWLSLCWRREGYEWLTLTIDNRGNPGISFYRLDPDAKKPLTRYRYVLLHMPPKSSYTCPMLISDRLVCSNEFYIGAEANDLRDYPNSVLWRWDLRTGVPYKSRWTWQETGGDRLIDCDYSATGRYAAGVVSIRGKSDYAEAVWLMDINTNAKRRLARIPMGRQDWHATHLQWNPSGDQLAYLANGTLYLVKV